MAKLLFIQYRRAAKVMNGGDQCTKRNYDMLCLRDNRIRFLIIKSKCFLMTSACEGFPMTLLEAQQCGCVPILYDSFASAKDVVTDGENGILIENRDKEAYVTALKKLMKDDALRNRMSEACIKLTERFSVENIAAQ